MRIAARIGIAALLIFGLPSGSGDPAAPQATAVLGGMLFEDAALSLDGTISCASCHEPRHAFADHRAIASGVLRKSGTRNVPSLLDLGSGPFFWDGRSASLEQTVTQPFINPAEMGLPDSGDLLTRLSRSRKYQLGFQRAFGSAAPSLPQVQQALAAYIRSLPRTGNAYDRYLAGDFQALSSEARHGLNLFAGSANCQECHRLDAGRFTDDDFHPTLIDPGLASALPAAAIILSKSADSESVLNARIESDAATSGLGRYLVTRDSRDIGSFRTPSLRNVAQTAPYMHDGAVATLRLAVDREIYYRNLQGGRSNMLTERDRRDLVAFLEALSDTPGSSALPVPRKQ